MKEYIDYRLQVAGRESNERLFADDTFDDIFRFTGGIPRLVNTLCDTALLVRIRRRESGLLALEDVQAAVTELGWKEHTSRTGMHRQLEPPRHRPQSRCRSSRFGRKERSSAFTSFRRVGW